MFVVVALVVALNMTENFPDSKQKNLEFSQEVSSI